MEKKKTKQTFNKLAGATRLYEKAEMHVQREYVTYEIELRPGEELQKE